MPSQCCVRGCSVRGNGHMFPRDEARKKQWLTAIRRKNYKPSIYAKVCKKHFTPEDYTLPKESVVENPLPILKKDAVPSVFSWSDTEDDTEEANPNPKRKRRTIKQAPVRPTAIYVSDNPVLKVPGLTQPIKAKLMRVPNDPSLIARLEAARKALADKSKVLKADLTMKVTSEPTQFKPISSSLKRLKKSLITDSQRSRNLNVERTPGYQITSNKTNAPMPSNELIQASQSPYTVSIEIQQIKKEKDTESEEIEFRHNSVNAYCIDPGFTMTQKPIKMEKEADIQVDDEPTFRTVDRTVQIDLSTSYVDRIMSMEKIKKEKDFVAVECVEVEFESKFKDKGVQCNLGDPCCSVSSRKDPQFGLEKYNNSSLKNFKKRRISV